MTKRRNKKYNPNKINDNHIPFLERSTSLIIKYINEFAYKIKTEITAENVTNHLLMTHRFTFMDDLEFTEIRWIAENLFIKLNKLLETNSELSEHYIIDIDDYNRDLVLLFLGKLKTKLYNITKRDKYAKLFQEMIVNHNIYCYDKLYISKWIDKKEVAEALACCRKRNEIDNIRKAKHQGKIAYVNDGGDIEFGEII